ncbi:alpha/beta hydrolase [Sphingomonas sp. MMS24-JH45]
MLLLHREIPDASILPQYSTEHDAPQHGPRPLPLFLDMLRSETATSPERRAAALAGLRRYQEAPRAVRRMAPARFRTGPARLRDHGGEGPPVVFVPSLINPAYVLDIAPGRSLVEHVAGAGFHAWLVDWGTPRPQDAGLDLAGHVERRLLPLIAKLDRPPLLVGYCLGGTLALAAAARLGSDVAGVATIAAPWRFAGYGGGRARGNAAAVGRGARLIGGDGRLADGSAPGRVLAARSGTDGRQIRLLRGDGRACRGHVRRALEDWANAGAPLTHGAARELFEDMLGKDRSGNGTWRVGDKAIDLSHLACPAIEFVSLTDRITPAATAGFVERHELAAGHVGMVVGSKARGMLWEPLTSWLAGTMDKNSTM